MNALGFYAMNNANGEQARKIIASMAERAGLAPEVLKMEVRIQFNGNLVLHREMHRDEMGRPMGDVVDTQKRAWTRIVEKHAAKHIAEVQRLEARRKAYDPEDKGRYEPQWAFDIHPITAALLRYYDEANNIPIFDRTQRLNGEIGRGITFDQDDAPSSPIEHLSIGYGSGVIRMGSAKFNNGMLFSYEEFDKVPFLVVPTCYPDSVLASLKGRPADQVIDILKGTPGIGLIKVVRAEEHALGTRIDFTNRLVPWESSQRDKASWRRTNLKQ